MLVRIPWEQYFSPRKYSNILFLVAVIVDLFVLIFFLFFFSPLLRESLGYIVKIFL